VSFALHLRSAAPSTAPTGSNAAWELCHDLPWLPAYDRRDVMVVAHLIHQLQPDLKLRECHLHALALSAVSVIGAFERTRAGNVRPPGDVAAQSCHPTVAVHACCASCSRFAEQTALNGVCGYAVLTYLLTYFTYCVWVRSTRQPPWRPPLAT
jgi:hypothetical protein